MTLLRDRPMQAVRNHLHLVRLNHGEKTVFRSALVQASEPIGVAPRDHLLNAVGSFNEHLQGHWVLVVDRGLMDYGRSYRYQKRGEERHWLVRARSNLAWTVLEILRSIEVIAEVPNRRPARRYDPTLPRSMQIRVICYQLPDFKFQ